jgi:uncharacterized protein (TIGR00255 family)
MLKSMTGFGRAETAVADKIFSIDIKSLNGKQLDVQLKLPSLLKPFEFDIRKLVAEKLNRGSVDCLITLKDAGQSIPVSINTQVARSYYQPLAKLAEELGLDRTHLLPALLKLPDVVSGGGEPVEANHWELLKKGVEAALAALDAHRVKEGKVLEADLLTRISKIEQLQQETEKLEPARRAKKREDLQRTIQEQVGQEGVDSNRLEQELIYYIEKMDISEELVRLRNHCDYFRSQLSLPEEGKGKKLSFILQEIGREINTTGSKAYDAAIQRLVVEMKDELEKAKEQILNVL